MRKRAFIVTGLGYGDEGKGSTVDWLTWYYEDTHTVIRTGGPQALHRVVTSDGREHVFQQFGSGTLRGADTHLSKHMLVAPHALLRELDALQPLCEQNVLVKTTVHKDALIVTPFQAITGRIRELLRGKNRRGTVGVGVGETIRDSEFVPDLVLYASDLYSARMPDKLANLYRYCRSTYGKLISDGSDVPPSVTTQFSALNNELLTQTIADFEHFARCVQLVDDAYVAEKILGKEGTVIIEGSQGVLLDRVHGLYPHTTKVRATPETGRAILSDALYEGTVMSLGVVRAYATRHGHGPFVTEDKTLTQQLPDAANKRDDWQGNFRVGHFDAVTTRYAKRVCGAGAFDGLVVTNVDRTLKLPTWSICTAYQHEQQALPDGSGSVMTELYHLQHVRTEAPDSISEFLKKCQPVLRTVNQKMQRHGIGVYIEKANEIAAHVKLPLFAVSAGETENEKLRVHEAAYA